MKRSRFLTMYGMGVAAAPVAISTVPSLLTSIQAPAKSSLTGKGLMDIINQQSNQSTYTVLTGTEGMKAFNEAMKDLSDEMA